MENQIIVITGGSSGLGKGLAKLLVSKGYKVVTCARDNEELDKAAHETGATPFVADVTKEGDMQALADFAVSSFGRIDVWINNAGIWMPHAPFTEMDMDKIKSLFDVNVFGVMYGSKYALLQMQKQRNSILVNIISTSGLSGRPTSSGYSASKWAVRGFTDSIREENKNSGIRIVSVYPGGMRTQLFNEQKPAEIEEYMSVESVAEKIVSNLELDSPEEQQIIRRQSS